MGDMYQNDYRAGNPDCTHMYGPPPDCKRFEGGEGTVCVNVSGLLVEKRSPDTR